MAFEWTMERERELRRRWSNGESWTEIAEAMGGGLSRSAVCGKAHRLKLEDRRSGFTAAHNRARAVPRADIGAVATTTLPARAPRPLVKVKAKKKADPRTGRPTGDAPQPPNVDELRGAVWEALAGTTPVKIEDVHTNGCKWPIGDPALFCDQRVHGEYSYCEYHARLAYRTPSEFEMKLVKHKGLRDG